MTKDLLFPFGLNGELSNTDKVPIGILVKQNRIPWLAIMNVSPLPLQKQVYRGNSTEAQSRNMRTLWCALEEIKSKLEKSSKRDINLCPISNGVYETIVSDLACRIGRIASRCHPKFIPFGNVARRSLRRVSDAGGSFPTLHISDVAVWHPSAWNRKNYRDRNAHLCSVAFEISHCFPINFALFESLDLLY